MSKRRQRRQAAKAKGQTTAKKAKTEEITVDVAAKKAKSHMSKWEKMYNKVYKPLLIIPFLILILSIAQIGYQISTTGDFVQKGVSLKGGVTITLQDTYGLDGQQLKDFLLNEFINSDAQVKEIISLGEPIGFSIEISDLPDNNGELAIQALQKKIPQLKDNYSIEVTGSVLGATFFEQVIKAILVAFSFMGVVVFFYFGKGTMIKAIMGLVTFINALLIFTLFFNNTFWTIVSTLILIGSLVTYFVRNMPSFAVILAVLSDTLITLAVINVLDIKLTTAGIAAFLMLIGYSVDTDIMLSTRVLKRNIGSVTSRIFNAAKTGLTMTFTTLVAITVALVVSRSEVLNQIMTIVLIGLIADLLTTWLQNAGLLKLYMKKRGEEE